MRKTPFLLAALAAGLLAPGCGGGGGSTGAPGTLQLHVTDAPFPFDFVASATVVIGSVEVRDAAGGGWTEVFAGPVEVDLVPLTGGVAELIASAELPPGTYDQVRLLVDGGSVTLEDEAVVDAAHGSHVFDAANGGMLFPSGAQTGIKVAIDPPVEVVTELSADLLLDVDLAKSFVFNGPPTHEPGVRRVLFKPVVRAANKSTTGRAVLEVRSDAGTPADTADDAALAGAVVTALDPDGNEVGGAVADAAGKVEVVLPGGTYDLVVEAADHAPTTLEDVVIAVANATLLPVVTLAATSTSIGGTVLSDNATPGDATDDLPLEGVTVTATPAGGGTPVQTTTAADGTYLLAGLAPGTWDLAFTRTGYADGAAAGVVSTAAGATADVTLAQDP